RRGLEFNGVTIACHLNPELVTLDPSSSNPSQCQMACNFKMKLKCIPRRIHNCSRGYSNARASLNARIRQNQQPRDKQTTPTETEFFARGCCDSIMEMVEKRLSCWTRRAGWMQKAP
ncbi:hypothetical protein PO909_032568, partial [Leuciscus waleckii]